tara:strand:+ start:2411 stop:3523 length:1113 start_codon:yes stop_codon:yes gene_type:complete
MTIFKTLAADDKVSTKTLLHEAIPLTGTIVASTYGTFPNERNIQNFTHGMFQSIYDYPYLSSSANHIFDISLGFHHTSGRYTAATSQKAKKNNIYNQMAQVLMGYDKDGNIQRFDSDGDLAAGGTKITDALFLTFSRLLVKDEIKKGSFEMTIGTTLQYSASNHDTATIKDTGAAQSYKVNSPAGEYGILYLENSPGSKRVSSAVKNPTANGHAVGLIYYQAGVAVLTSSIFEGGGGGNLGNGFLSSSVEWNAAGGHPITSSMMHYPITASADYLRKRIVNIQFNNTIELNSTVYFCRVKHNEFNYSSNPTYLTGSQIRVKNETGDIPISYITSIGLYSADNELLAVGKFSEPIRKDNNIEMIFRARLDY